MFAPTPLVPPAGALTWGCCGESTVEAALSFASFLYIASWLPVSGEVAASLSAAAFTTPHTSIVLENGRALQHTRVCVDRECVKGHQGPC